MMIGWIAVVLWVVGLCLVGLRGKYAWLGALLMGMGIGALVCVWLTLAGVVVR